MKKYFQILGIEENSPVEDIKKAYRKLAKKYHPDINKNTWAAEKFMEINEAYEILIHNASTNHKPFEPGSWEYQDFINKVREQAQQRARMKYEKLQKEHEAFRESGLYDIGIVLKFIGLLLYPFVAIGLVFSPFYIAWYYKEPFIIGYLSFFLIVGGFLCFDIYQRRNHYFKLNNLYYNWPKIKEYFTQINTNSNQSCFYCNGLQANSHPFTINIIHIKSIHLQNMGPLQHRVGYKRTEEKVFIPRSQKAFIIHFIISSLKILVLLSFILFAPIDSIMFRIIGGLLGAWLISFLILKATQTRSKVGFLFSWAMLIKFVLWVTGLSIVSNFSITPFNITSTEYLPVTIVALMIIDVILEQILKLPKANLYKPLLTYYNQYANYFSKQSLLYLEVPFWTTIYPIIRWLI